jgi:hypothetical protein
MRFVVVVVTTTAREGRSRDLDQESARNSHERARESLLSIHSLCRMYLSETKVRTRLSAKMNPKTMAFRAVEVE